MDEPWIHSIQNSVFRDINCIQRVVQPSPLSNSETSSSSPKAPWPLAVPFQLPSHWKHSSTFCIHRLSYPSSHVDGIAQGGVFSGRLLSLSAVFSRFIHTGAYVKAHPFLLGNNIPLSQHTAWYSSARQSMFGLFSPASSCEFCCFCVDVVRNGSAGSQELAAFYPGGWFLHFWQITVLSIFWDAY